VRKLWDWICREYYICRIQWMHLWYAAPAPAPVPTRIETPMFVGEIRQEGGKWIGELKYKNGAGKEIITASSESELLLSLLEVKGHEMIRLGKALRREKYGFFELDRGCLLLPGALTSKDFEAMPDATRDVILDAITLRETVQFSKAHPEFFNDLAGNNVLKIRAFLAKNHLPVTFKNLGYAFDELSDPSLPDDVRLRERPVQPLGGKTE
jgi:hypothetical protein